MTEKNNFYIDLINYKKIIKEEKIVLSEIPVRLTTFENGFSNKYGTFEESINFSGDTKELSFSIFKYINKELNPFWSYIVPDRKLRLSVPSLSENYIEFYITKLSPSVTNDNVKYAVTCQDSFSYDLTKQNISITISTNDEQQWGLEVGPQTIDKLIKKVLEVAYINYIDIETDISRWRLDPEFQNLFFEDTFKLGERMRVSLEMTSTPFNIITEILKLFNANLVLDYENHLINVEYKEYADLKGLTLRPEYNLSSFGYTEDSNELFNIMHVQGGEDAKGNLISLLPPLSDELRNFLLKTSSWKTAKNIEELMIEFDKENSTRSEETISFLEALKTLPHAGNFFYNFEYWLNKKIIDKTIYNDIINDLNVSLRNINLEMLCYYPLFYERLYYIESVENQQKNLVASIAALQQELADTDQTDNSLNGLQRALVKTIDGVEYVQIFKYNELEAPIFGDSFNYGFMEKVDYRYFLPSIADLKNDNAFLIIENYNSEGEQYTECKIQNVDIDLSTFVCDTVIESTNFAIYRNLDSSFKLTENVNVEGLNQYNQTDYANDFNEISNDLYVDYLLSVYGSNYLDERIAKFNGLLDAALRKKNEIEIELINLTGAKSITEAINMVDGPLTNIENRIKHGELVTERDYLIRECGGVGRTGRSFLGYYRTFIEQLKLLKNKHSEKINSFEGVVLKEKINQLEDERKKWWQQFYSRYHSIIRETYYEDSNQLTSEGLFSAAYKQFKIYSDLNKDYNISYLTTDDLLPFNSVIKVGDHIRVFVKEVFYDNSNKHFSYLIRKNNLTLRLGETLMFKNDDSTIYGIIINLQEDHIYYTAEVLFKEGLEDPNDIYSYRNEDYIIDGILPTFEEKPIRLRVNAINKKLRESTTSLTVEDKTLINQVVDKLLTLIS